MMFNEKKLSGGRTATNVVQIGNTVRRTVKTKSQFTRDLLKLLEKKHFEYSPRFLGIDEKGREILTFTRGSVPHKDMKWTNSQLISIVIMIKKFHDATEGSNLTGKKEVVCHNDISPWNIVMLDNRPVGLIDFDSAAPGKRADDLGYFLWTFLKLGSDINANLQAKRMQLLSRAYGFYESKALIHAILQQQKRILIMRQNLAKNSHDKKEKNFSSTKVASIRSEIKWVQNNRRLLESSL